VVDFMDGYRQGYQDALADLARRGVISMGAAALVGTGPSGMSQAISEAVETAQASPQRRSRRRRRKDPKLSKAFKEANARLRTKSGKLRKGKTQSDVARLAQRLRKKM
jgi:hypothetical protein